MSLCDISICVMQNDENNVVMVHDRWPQFFLCISYAVPHCKYLVLFIVSF